jgi:hypothetical protein
MTNRPSALQVLHDELTRCRRCERLVAWRENVATTKRRAYRDEEYWGRPVVGFGDPNAGLVIVGLAPGPTGRIAQDACSRAIDRAIFFMPRFIVRVSRHNRRASHETMVWSCAECSSRRHVVAFRRTTNLRRTNSRIVANGFSRNFSDCPGRACTWRWAKLATTRCCDCPNEPDTSSCVPPARHPFLRMAYRPRSWTLEQRRSRRGYLGVIT